MDFLPPARIGLPINQAVPELTPQLKILRLEYICTHAEMEEAQSLLLRKQFGRGSKWLTQAVLILLLIGMLLGLYFKMGQIFSANLLPYAYATTVAGCLGFVFWRRLNRKRRGLARFEVSERGLAILGTESRIDVPWSGLGDLLESPKVFALLDRQKGVIFALPKRAFPDDASQEWFRALAKLRPAQEYTTPVDSVPEIAIADQIKVNFQLGFRDYVSRALASHRVAAMILAVLLLFVVTTVYNFVNPPPDAINSPLKVLLVFEIPFWALMVPFMYLVVSIATWRQHKKYLVPQEVILSAKSIRITSRDENSALPWSSYPRYKETRRLFILWNPRGRGWLMIPKRAFASKEDQERCRMLLAGNSRAGRWYFG